MAFPVQTRGRSDEAELVDGFREVTLWGPNPGPQTAFVACPVDDVLYGGGRGGGKSDGLIGSWILHQRTYSQHARGIIFRRTYDELEELEVRAIDLLTRMGADYKQQKRTFVWREGARLKLRYLERDKDYGRYHGHQYCVAKGTPVLMADGSYKPIEEVRLGEFVQTLEGAKPVTDTMPARLSECVKAEVFSRSGEKIGEQIHPTTHPILTSVLWHARQPDGLCQTFVQSHQPNEFWTSYKSLLCAGRESQDFGAWSTGEGNALSECCDLRQEIEPLPALYVPVVLYEPDLRSDESATQKSIQFDALDKWHEWSQKRCRVALLSQRWKLSDRRLPDELPQRFPACNASHSLVDAASCGEIESQGVRGFQFYCPLHLRFCDAQPLCRSNSVPDGVPSQGDAASHNREDCRLDAQGSIPDYNPDGVLSYVHPYSGMRRDVKSRIVFGASVFTPVGEREVYDLTVADANHYITSSRLINKNTFLGADEVTNWASPKTLDKLRSCLRSAHGVPCLYRVTGNPGGPGHNWVKERYVTPDRLGWTPFYDEKMECWRVYIPSVLKDNPRLVENDPNYWKRVRAAAAANEALIKAWAEGDWDIVSGGAFDDLWRSPVHVLQPFDIPDDWTITRCFDWGSAHPFACLYTAESDGTTAPNGVTYPRGTVFVIAEDYGWNGNANEGTRQTASGVASRLAEFEQKAAWGKRVAPGPADTQIWDVGAQGVAIYDDFKAKGVHFTKADKSKGSRKSGYQRVRQMLHAALHPELGEPGLHFFKTAKHCVRTIPVLMRSETDPDDVDTEQEDHCYDALRYRVSRKSGAWQVSEWLV